MSYDGVHPPDSLAVTAAGIAVYAYFFGFVIVAKYVKLIN